MLGASNGIPVIHMETMSVEHDAVEWWKSGANCAAIRDYALQCGLLLRVSEDPNDDRCTPVSVTVLPSKFPEELFQLACAVQQDVNNLLDAVSRDHGFLESVLGR